MESSDKKGTDGDKRDGSMSNEGLGAGEPAQFAAVSPSDHPSSASMNSSDAKKSTDIDRMVTDAGQANPGSTDDVEDHAMGVKMAPTEDGALKAMVNDQLLMSSCAYYDESANKYVWRPVIKTPRAHLAIYGAGIKLYFDFVYYMGLIMYCMGVLCTPMLILNYIGDAGGSGASFFSELTIGNIGYCGSFGQFCDTYDHTAARLALPTTTLSNPAALSKITPLLSVLDVASVVLFIAFIVFFRTKYVRSQLELINASQVTLSDYSIEVDLLPPKLENTADHSRYAELLARHFEDIVGEPDTVEEVVLARDFHGAIGQYLTIGNIEIDRDEAKSRSEVLKDDLKKKAEGEKAKKLDKELERTEKFVRKESEFAECERDVVRAFITFAHPSYVEDALYAYRWARISWLFRYFQFQKQRFQGKPILAKEAPEPGSIFWENVDFPKNKRMWRQSFTCVSLIFVLIACGIVLLYAALGSQQPSVSATSKQLWIVANMSTATGGCFEACGVEMFTDTACTLRPTAAIKGLVDSSGRYTPVSPFMLNNADPASCSLGAAWSPRTCRGNARYPVRSLGSLPASTYCGGSTNTCTSTAGLQGQYCFTNAQKCDHTVDCPNGEDEDNTISSCSSYTCPTGTVRCPSSLICVNANSDRCPECYPGSAYASNSVCTAYATRLAGSLATCSATSVATFVTQYSGSCSTQTFWVNPDCYMTQLDAAASGSDSSLVCLASSYTDFARNKEPLESYMRRYAYQKQTTASLSTCTAAQVETLTSLGPNCVTARTRNDRWCECLFDMSLLQPAEKLALDTCSVSGFGNTYGFYNYTSAVSMTERVRQGCEQNYAIDNGPLVRNYATYTNPSPFLKVSFTIGTVGGAETTSHINTQLYTFLGVTNTSTNPAWNITSYIDANSQARVIIALDDRSSSTAAARNTTVLNAYNSINTNIPGATSGSTGISFSGSIGAIRTRLDWEPFCNATTGANAYQCALSRICLSSGQVCDGIPDCGFYSTGSDDEYSCSALANSITSLYTSSSAYCSTFQYDCGDTAHTCIPDVNWCDGVADCPNGADETGSECQVEANAMKVLRAQVPLYATNATDWFGFHYPAGTNVECIKFAQPVTNQISSVKVYGCDSSVVFRQGFNNSILRNPDAVCTPYTLSSVTSQTYTVTVNSSATTATYTGGSVPLMTCQLLNGVDPCPQLTNNAAAACVNNTDATVLSTSTGFGTCRVPISATSDTTLAFSTSAACTLSNPISFVEAKGRLLQYGNDSTSLLADFTYNCYCSQLVSYNILTNPLYILPPYTSDNQRFCQLYLKSLIQYYGLLAASVVAVAVLNFVLRIVIYYLVSLERHDSLTNSASSQMWKLFLAQWVNTAVIVLLVNGNFHSFNVAGGIGAGQYSEMTKTWYTKVGAGICITILVQIVSASLPALVTGTWTKWSSGREAMKCKTVRGMNKWCELPDFEISMRLAQTMNVMICVVMYYAGMPVLLYIGALYCFVGYWLDKFVLLRLSRMPPAFGAEMIQMACTLAPLGVVLHLCLGIYMYSNQVIFPSGWAIPQIQSIFNSYNQLKYQSYLTGDVDIPNNSEFQWYVGARILESARQAPLPLVILLFLLVLYGAYVVFWSLFARKILSGIKVMFSCCFRRVKQVDRTGSASENMRFRSAKKRMEQDKLLTSYKLSSNPRYYAAYQAITDAHRESIRRRSSSKSPSPVASAMRLEIEMSKPAVESGIARATNGAGLSPEDIASLATAVRAPGTSTNSIPMSNSLLGPSSADVSSSEPLPKTNL